MRFHIVLPALLLLSAFSLMGCNQTASSQPANNSSYLANSVNPPIAQKTPEEMKRISLENAKTVYNKDNAVIVDVRDPDSFAQEHIKGAINIPLPEFEKRLSELPLNKQIIAYCS